MKILFTSGAFYPDNHGGPSYSIYWLAKGLASNSIDVTVVTSDSGLDGKFPVDKFIEVDKIRVRYCARSIPKFPLKLIYYGIKEIANTDILHLSSVCFLPSSIFAFIGVLFRKKIFWSTRGELAEEAINANTLKKIYFSLLKFIFSKRIIFHSTSKKETKELCKYLSPKNIVEFPNYMELVNTFNYQPSEKYILYVGRINRIKALHKLIKALSLSKNFMASKMIFKIAGDPNTFHDYYIELTELINELDLNHKIQFLGRIDGEEKQQLYANAYFFFLVSESENFGNVVIEAMAQGTPVVSSLGTPWELLSINNIGFHVDNSPESLACVIDKIIDIPDTDYLRLRNMVKDFCWDNFSIQKNVNKWINAYNRNY